MSWNKEKNQKLISVGTEKVFDRIRNPFMKRLTIVRMKGNFLCLFLCGKPTANTVFSGRRPKALPPDQEQGGCPLSPLAFSILLEVLARAVRWEKEIKDIEKEEVELSLQISWLLSRKPARTHIKTYGANKQIQQNCRIWSQYKNHLHLYVLAKKKLWKWT